VEPALREELRILAAKVIQQKVDNGTFVEELGSEEEEEDENELTDHTPEARLKMYREMAEV
jgi:hypothetical protein